MTKKMGNLIRHRKFTVDEVLKAGDELYDKKWSRLPKLGVHINTNALAMWRKHGVGCCIEKCGRAGVFFAAERTPGKGSMYNEWHLNLYALDENGDEVLMTQDHVLARANGGEDNVDNLQPMCYPHNQKKGDKEMSVFLTRVDEANKQSERRVKKTADKAMLARVKVMLVDKGLVFNDDFILSMKGPSVVVKTGGNEKLTPELLDKIKSMGALVVPFVNYREEHATTKAHE